VACNYGLAAVGAEVNRLEAEGDYAAVAEAVVVAVAESSGAWVRLMRDSGDGRDPLYDVGDDGIAVK